MKHKLLVMSILFCLFYIGMQCFPYEKEKGPSFFYREDHIKVIAHGGAKLLFPENTIYAFEQVMKYPIDGLEVDLRLTKDEQLVSIHDANIEAYTNHQGKVSEYTYAQLKTMNFGYHFVDLNKNYPFQQEVSASMQEKLVPIEVSMLLEKYKDVFLILEVKDTGDLGKKAMEILYEKIIESKREKDVLVCSFDKNTLIYFIHINKKKITCVMDKVSASHFILANYVGYDLFLEYTQKGLMLPLEVQEFRLDCPYLIWKIHKNNKFVYYWTVNEVEDMKKLIEEGADGIISDRIDLIYEVLEEMK